MTLFAEASTLGTILVVFVYFVANLALPVYYRRHHPDQFSPVRHLVIPLVGAALIALPIYELVKPGQKYPYDWFPYIALAVIVVAVGYAVVLNARDKTLADRVGSLVADDATDGKFAGFLDEEEEQLHRLRRIVTCLNQDRDTRSAVQEALQIIAEALHMASAAVFVVRANGTAEVLAACGDTRRGFPYPPLDLADPLIAGAIKRPRIIEIAEPVGLNEALLAVTGSETGRVVIAPQSAGPEVAAIMVLGRTSSEPLTKRETEFVAVVSESMGLAIRSRSLAAESQHTAAVLQTAYAVSRAITQSLDLELTYREIAANAARVAPGSHCLLFELERGTGDYLAVACSDPESEELLATRVWLQDDSAGSPCDHDAPDFVVRELISGDRTDARSTSKFSLGGHLDARLAGLFNGESSVLVPLFAQQELVGSLLVYASGRRRHYSELEIAELRSVGEQAAIAIHNALLYRNLAESQASVEALLTRLTRIRDQERQALARVVHDDIVQSIVGAIYRLDDVRDTVAEHEAAEFDQAVAVLRQSVDDARRVIWELRPPAIDGLGLPAALRSLADRAGHGEAAVKVSIDEIAGLSDAVTTGLYKIAREALLNAIHHASAREIGITLVDVTSAGRTAARLLVEDDGVGFVVEPERDGGRDGGHYGTVMMEEQATLIGATMSIDTEPGSGTRVEVVVPLSATG